MKSTRKDQIKSTVFPKLMIYKNDRDVLLVTGVSKVDKTSYVGMIVYVTDDSENYIGCYGTTWASTCFTDYDGEVTLSNEG